MKYAVIIKHPYRDHDWRVDIVDVPHDTNPAVIRRIIEGKMLGPFEVIAVTAKLDVDRNISDSLERITRDTEKHIET